MKLSNKKDIYLKTRLPILAIFIGLLLLPLAIASSASSNLNDLYSKKSDLSKEISDKTKAANEKKKQAAELASNIQKINNNISEAEAKINDLESQINQTQQEITNTEGQIKEKEAELAKENNNKQETLKEIYQTGELSTIELLISSSTLSAVIDQNQYFELLENKIETTISQISMLKADLENKKGELNKKNDSLKNLKGEQEAYKQGLDGQKREKDIVLKDTKSQQKTLEQQVAEAKKYSSQVQAQIASIQASLNQSSGRVVLARDRGTSSVGFSWPADYKYISAYYGESTPFQAAHSGIDLANIPGTPVLAAADGTVITASSMMLDGRYYGYGNYIVIGHNAKYSSLYGHLMGFNVSVGQEVKKGDVIGYLGNTGWSTGPHLHFEVWDNGSRVNPMGFLP